MKDVTKIKHLLFSHALDRHTIGQGYDAPVPISKRGECSLLVMRGVYFMVGPSGIHRLAGSETTKARLAAHWAGFCEYNGQCARTFNMPPKYMR